MVASDTTTIAIEETDEIAVIKFNRPDYRNAFNLQLIEDFYNVLSELNKGANKGLLLTGEGPVTTAGADTSIVGGDDDDKKNKLTGRINDIYELIHDYPRPTVMAVKGAAIGAGFQLALSVDFSVIGEESKLLKPEIEYGVFSEYSTRMIADQTSKNIAREIALAGNSISPEQALQWGLVTQVVPESKVESEARELLNELASYDSTCYQKTKESLAFSRDVSEFENYP
jgi:enoyl-CoA hydratase/carnithine racemase